MNSKNILFTILALGVIGFIIYSFWSFWTFPNFPKTSDYKINNFSDCEKAGYPVAESYPRSCYAEGRSHTEDIGNELEKSDLITVENPRPNTLINSPLEIRGSARGNWFFEASFPIVLVDEKGEEVASGIATAVGEWMTEEFVPFKATLKFKLPATTTGELILKKDNPSGLPENDDALRVPVKF